MEGSCCRPRVWTHHLAHRVCTTGNFVGVLLVRNHPCADVQYACSSKAPDGLLHTCRGQTRHTSLATYVLLRGIVLLVRCANKEQETSSLLRKLLAPTRCAFSRCAHS